MNNTFLGLFVKTQTRLADFITRGAFSDWRRNYEEEWARHRVTSAELAQLKSMSCDKTKSESLKNWISSRCIRVYTSSGSPNYDGQTWVHSIDYNQSQEKLKEAITWLENLEVENAMLKTKLNEKG